MNIKEVTKKILPFLCIPFILGGCSKVDCDIKEDHVHKYVARTSNGTIVNYFNSEDTIYMPPFLQVLAYKSIDYYRDNEYLLATEDDLNFYKVRGASFKGSENWIYLFNLMKNKRDYIEYRYRDSDDDPHWTTDKNKSRKTGLVRVNHYRFFGYKIVWQNGQYIKVRSPLVDDIRDIIDEYDYFDHNCYEEVYKEYNFNRSIVDSIRLEDIDEFVQPDLSNPSMIKVK